MKKIGLVVLFLLGAAVSFALFGTGKDTELTAAQVPNDFLVIGHRGASAYAPEHTLAAYRLAHEMGAEYLEIDLQQTKDGGFIAMHDEQVDRTTNEKGFVRSFTLAEIQKTDAGSWFNEAYPEKADETFSGLTVPSLREIFEVFGTQVNYYIETKSPADYPNMEQELLRLLEEYDLLKNPDSGKVVIQSFSKESLLQIHQANTEIPLIQLLNKQQAASMTKEDILDIANYAAGIGINHNSLTEDLAQHIRDAGLELHPYTVNTEESVLDMIEMGATGVFTDYIDLVPTETE